MFYITFQKLPYTIHHIPVSGNQNWFLMNNILSPENNFFREKSQFPKPDFDSMWTTPTQSIAASGCGYRASIASRGIRMMKKELHFFPLIPNEPDGLITSNNKHTVPLVSSYITTIEEQEFWHSKCYYDYQDSFWRKLLTSIKHKNSLLLTFCLKQS